MFGGPSLRLFRLAGFDVSAHWSLLIGVGLMALTLGGAFGVWLAILLFASVLLHELGHSVVARKRRVPIDGIELHLFGGVAKMAAPPRSPKDEIAIAIAGPIVSLALGLGLGAAAWALGPAGPSWLPWIAGANLTLGVFNLVPALPMDGGRVLRAVLARRMGLSRGTRLSVRLNRLVAVGLGIFGLFTNLWLVALALIIWMMGSAELAQIRRHEVLQQHGFVQDPWDPWARYQRASEREAQGSQAASEPLVPEVLPPEKEEARRPRTYQRFAREPLGRWVVVTHRG